MNREEFMRQLAALLSDISEEERNEALRFYESYFEDAGERNEQKILKELESPQKVADTIKRELGASEENIKKDSVNGTFTKSNGRNGTFAKDDGVNGTDTRTKGNGASQGRSRYTYFKGTKTGRDEYGRQYKERSQYEKDPYGQKGTGYNTYNNGNEKNQQKLPSWALVLIVVGVCVAGLVVSFTLIFAAFGFRFANNLGNLIKRELIEEGYVTEDVPFWFWDDDYDDYYGDGVWEYSKNDESHDSGDEAAGNTGSIGEWNVDSDAGTVNAKLDPSSWEEIVELKLRSGKLEFTRSSDEYLYIDMKGKYVDKIIYYQDNIGLYIEDTRTRKQAKQTATVTIAVPEGYQFGELDIDIDAAEISSEIALEAKNIDIKAGAGVIKLDTVEAQSELTLDVGAGEIVVKDGSCKTFEAKCGVGTLEMTGEVEKDIEITCGLGNVELYVPGVQEPYNYKVKCGAGDVTVGGRSYAGLASAQTVDNGGTRNLSVECGLGSVLVQFTDR